MSGGNELWILVIKTASHIFLVWLSVELVTGMQAINILTNVRLYPSDKCTFVLLYNPKIDPLAEGLDG